MDEDADVYVMMPDTLPEGDVVVSVQDPSAVGKESHSPKSHFIFHSVHDNGDNIRNNHKFRVRGKLFTDVRRCMTRIRLSQHNKQPARMSEAESIRATPSLETERTADGRSFEPCVPSVPETSKVMTEPEKRTTTVIASQPEIALFATTLTTGILDLGASQSVMGQHQVPEFLANLPKPVRELVQERPVSMSFRFGNNSIVPCHRALLVPVDRFWIKIAIVETQTPFLISNNVCRSLGAVIDTNQQSIFFKVLNCELPLELSSRKLFMLDFCVNVWKYKMSPDRC